MRIIYRGPSIVASYQVSVHLAKRFQRGIFKNIDQSEKELPVATCLLTDQEMTNRYRGPFIDASCHVSFIWLSGYREEDL